MFKEKGGCRVLSEGDELTEAIECRHDSPVPTYAQKNNGNNPLKIYYFEPKKVEPSLDCPSGCYCSCVDNSKGAHARIESRTKKIPRTQCAYL